MCGVRRRVWCIGVSADSELLHGMELVLLRVARIVYRFRSVVWQTLDLTCV